MVLDPMLLKKRDDVLAIAGRYGGRKIRVFGSRVKGHAGPASDVDILLELEAGRSLLDIVAIKQDLAELLGCEVDVVTESALSPYIRDEILKEAVSL